MHALRGASTRRLLAGGSCATAARTSCGLGFDFGFAGATTGALAREVVGGAASTQDAP